MDATLIQEIANQLGMAVDQAGQFITDNLPQFAGMKVMYATVPLVIVWALFGIITIAALVPLCIAAFSRHKAIKKKEEDRENESYGGYYRTDWDNYNSFYVFFILGIIAICSLLIAAIATACLAPEIVGWSNYPDAMLIDMAIKAVG